MATPNYTAEQTENMIARYEAGESLDSIAEGLNKSVNSVRAKLVREGVYTPAERTVVAKDRGPKKAEILADLQAEVGEDFDVSGLKGATKGSISTVLAYIRR